jgi:hypothetical protein
VATVAVLALALCESALAAAAPPVEEPAVDAVESDAATDVEASGPTLPGPGSSDGGVPQSASPDAPPSNPDAAATATIGVGAAAAAAADLQDVVESIANGDDGSAPPFGGTTPAASDVRFDVFGLGLFTSELVRGRGEVAPDGAAVPHDLSSNRLQLLVRTRYARARSFEVSASGLLTYDLLIAQAAAPNSSASQPKVRGVGEALLRELYLGFYSRRVDLRVGQQRLVWGRAEFLNPNDVMNARDTRDPFIQEPELTHLPTPMIRADFDLASLALQLVAAPYFVPDTYDVYGSNWAAIQQDAPQNIRALMAVVNQIVDPSLQSQLQPLIGQTRLPARDLTAPVLGEKLSFRLGRADLSQYYQYGFDGPMLKLAPALLLGPPPSGPADLAPLLQFLQAGGRPIEAAYVRRHHFGIDAAVPLGPVVLRVDAAYQTRKVFYRQQDFTSFNAPVLTGVLGLEYQSGDPDKVVILEGYGLRVLDSVPPPLLFYERDTVGVSTLVRYPLIGRFATEIRLSGGIEPRMYLLQPQLTWKNGPWILALGALALNGEAGSLGDYYHRNTELYMKAKLGF